MGLTTATAGQRITANLLNRIYAEADGTSRTVTAASATALSSTYTIPANDAAVGTAYRLSAFGNGTWGSTQQQLQIYTYTNGVQIQNAGIPATGFTASQAIYWQASWLLIFTTTGSTANYNNSEIVQMSTNSASTTSNSPVRTGSNTVDTTAAITLQFQASWAATTGAPTITCIGTLFERLN